MAGVWLIVCLPTIAGPIQRLNGATLIAQNNLFDVALRLGSSGTRVIELQQALQSLRLFPGEITGFFGEETRHAVRQYQRIRQLEVTGVADAETLRELGLNPAAVLPVMIHPIHGGISTDRLELGDDSSDVITLQNVLIGYGFDITPDGDYGQATSNAVLAYQTVAGLPQNGIADRETLLHMGFEPGSVVASNINFVEGTDIGGPIGESLSEEGRYVAAIIAGPSELSNVRQDFPGATVKRSNLGEYISLGRFVDYDDADDLADFASDLGYEARVLRD